MSYKIDAAKTLRLYAEAIGNTCKKLDENFNFAVNMILNCQGRVVVSGIGKSGLVGQKMVATFASTGTPSFFLHPTEAFHGDLGMLKPIDIVILISYSGETDDVNKLIPSLKNFGNKIISMTGNMTSTLAKHSDISLNISISREACPNNLAPTTSSLITMALGDALAIALINARNFKPEDFARYHPGGSLGRKLLYKVKDVMHRNLPIVNLNTTFNDCLYAMNNGRMGVAIVMEGNQLKGIITDGDIRRALTKKGGLCLQLLAHNIMTTQPKTISENTFVSIAEEQMKQLKIHSLIALKDDGSISGIFEFNN